MRGSQVGVRGLGGSEGRETGAYVRDEGAREVASRERRGRTFGMNRKIRR
jgi:hypothetical protein